MAQEVRKINDDLYLVTVYNGSPEPKNIINQYTLKKEDKNKLPKKIK